MEKGCITLDRKATDLLGRIVSLSAGAASDEVREVYDQILELIEGHNIDAREGSMLNMGDYDRFVVITKKPRGFELGYRNNGERGHYSIKKGLFGRFYVAPRRAS